MLAYVLAAVVAWLPTAIAATSDTLDTVLAKMRTEDRDAGLSSDRRIDRYVLADGSRNVTVRALIRGRDYALSAEVAGVLPRLGRADGMRWRQSTSGTVHTIRADVQGDDFDRWPVAVLGFDANDCTLLGVSRASRNTWVIADRPALDIPRWLFVDRQTGDIVREVSREGNRVEVYDFADVRGDSGARRAYAWRISGPGGQVSVTLQTAAAADVSASEVAIPPQGPSVFDEPKSPVKIDARFDAYERIFIGVRLDGALRDFQLDSGTPELIISDLPPAIGPIVLEHGVVATVDAGGIRARNAAFLSVDFFEDGLLGYEFFRGRIVHVDYRERRVDLLPRDAFVAPDDAIPLPTDWSEGLPIVTASVGTATGARFALDLGSQELFLSRTFVDGAGTSAGLDLRSATQTSTHYLEGGVRVLANVRVASLLLGGIRFADARAQVEIADRDNLSLALDGIIGTRELAHCEWWFDADGPVSWFRPSR